MTRHYAESHFKSYLASPRHFLAIAELVGGHSNFLVKADFFIFSSSNVMYSHSAVR